MSTKIALFSRGTGQINVLRDILLEKGAKPLVFALPLGGESAPKVSFEGDKLIWDDVDFSDIDAVHIRGIAVNTPAAVPAVLNAASHAELRAKYFKEQAYQAATFSFLTCLAAQGKLVVNLPTGAYIDHDTKAQFYQKLRAHGFAAPNTLMTNDPVRALAFVQAHEVVAKPAMGIGSTRKVTEANIEGLDELRVSPVLLQEYFPGDTIRVHIVGDSVVLALRVLSDGQVDSRTSPKGFEYFRLPDEEQQKIVKANRMLGLHYAAWDVLAAPDGRYVYLDCNPGPFILWIGEENTRGVLQALADYMLTYARTHSLEEASRAVQPCRPKT
jgi:hypothetical protein